MLPKDFTSEGPLKETTLIPLLLDVQHPAVGIIIKLSYSTVVLYIGIMKVWGFWFELSPQNQLDICFLALWEYWLGLPKPKNVFRSTLDPSIK